MKKYYFLAYAILVMGMLPVSVLGSSISLSDFRINLPGDWKTDIQADGVSAVVNKDKGGFYKTFSLSLSENVSEIDYRKSKDDFSQHFGSIESKDKNLKLVAGDLVLKNKAGISFDYFMLFGIDKNVLTFYALAYAKNQVMLISYRIYRVTEDKRIWEEEFKAILNGIM